MSTMQQDGLVNLAKLRQALPWQESMQSSSKFYCLLDEQPLYLVPEDLLLNALNTKHTKLFLNPSCWFSGKHFPPLAALPYLSLLDKFFLESECIWVSDPITSTVVPFWLGPEYREMLLALWSGKLHVEELPLNIRSVLAQANILISYEDLLKRREEWVKTISCYTNNFKRGYTTLQGLIHPFHIGALRRYYRRLIREGGFQLGDVQSSRRYVAYNEGVARFYHQQLTGIVSCVTETPVKPSYVYVAAYQSGADLPKHVDREQCEYTITFCVDYSSEAACEPSWPIFLETEVGAVPVYQRIGDALIFKGRQLPHYRDALAAGLTYTSIFFHYVREDFTGPLQ
ncbi:MAG TPA: hypothetical protein VKY19_03130 [Ktedonosporobacter sp.]|nr:hypothetical protein [Ktedonosporobacter sp.]